MMDYADIVYSQNACYSQTQCTTRFFWCSWWKMPGPTPHDFTQCCQLLATDQPISCKDCRGFRLVASIYWKSSGQTVDQNQKKQKLLSFLALLLRISLQTLIWGVISCNINKKRGAYVIISPQFIPSGYLTVRHGKSQP